MRMNHCSVALLSLAAIGCGTEAVENQAPPPTAPADTGSSRDAASEPDIAVGPNPTNEELAVACLAACAARAVDGGCVPPDGACDTICFDAGVSAPQYFEHTLGCLEEDPLCYQSLAQCALGRAFPEPFPHRVTLRGSGYDEWVGVPVTAAVEVSADVFVYGSTAVNDAGGFEMAIEVTMHGLAPHIVLFWLDRNADGICDPDTEPTGSATYQFGSLTDVLAAPDWVIEVDRAETPDAAFVCDFI